MTVKYKEYDATSNTEDLIRTEIITVNGAMFKKLQYSNIDKILDIQLKTRDGKTINNVKYQHPYHQSYSRIRRKKSF